MVVHLGAGLAQSLGQLINVWSGGLPVVVITFAGVIPAPPGTGRHLVRVASLDQALARTTRQVAHMCRYALPVSIGFARCVWGCQGRSDQGE